MDKLTTTTTDKRIDRKIDRQTDRQTGRYMGRCIDSCIEKQEDRRIHSYMAKMNLEDMDTQVTCQAKFRDTPLNPRPLDPNPSPQNP